MTKQEVLYSQIEESLKGYSDVLKTRYPANLYDPIVYTISLGGKRIRPILLLLACDLFDGDTQNAVDAACGIEIFHNFTLLHDDIMDKAPLRRNQLTVHQKWNPDIAILSGDAMFVHAVQKIANVPDNCRKKVIDIFTKAAIEVCEGQQMDMDFESNPLVSLNEYKKMITLKTSVLLAAAMQIGAAIGGARDEDADSIYNFGKNIGIAFQLQDDILDVFGDPGKVGKKEGGDIVANKKTFLLIKALEIADRYKKEELLLWMQASDKDAQAKVEAVKNIYRYLDIQSLAQKEMEKHYNEAMLNLNKLPCNPDKKNILVNLAEKLMNRQS